MASVTAAHVLEDFIECNNLYFNAIAIETVPEELRQSINKIRQLSKQFEECRHTLYRKRNLLLRNDDKVKLNPEMRTALLRKIERESTKLDDLLSQKMKFEEHVEHLIERNMKRFDEELTKQTEYRIDPMFPIDNDSQGEDSLLNNPAIDDMTEALIKYNHCASNSILTFFIGFRQRSGIQYRMMVYPHKTYRMNLFIVFAGKLLMVK